MLPTTSQKLPDILRHFWNLEQCVVNFYLFIPRFLTEPLSFPLERQNFADSSLEDTAVDCSTTQGCRLSLYVCTRDVSLYTKLHSVGPDASELLLYDT